MKYIAVCLLFLMMPFSSLACDSTRLVSVEDEWYMNSELSDYGESCSEVFYGDSLVPNHLLTIDLFPEENSTTDYWSMWGSESEYDPQLTQKIAKSYIGLGVWMPPELLDQQSNMTTEEWLKSHGLLFSLGFGDKESGEPRVRMDYRWHEDTEVDLMMHFELPF